MKLPFAPRGKLMPMTSVLSSRLYLWPFRLRSDSPDQQFTSWEHLRSGLGKGYYIRTGTLIWCSVVMGVYPLLDLMYNMATHDKPYIDRSWFVVLVCSTTAGFLVYRRSWLNNERVFLDKRRDILGVREP